jgi:hypothetical protein
MQMMNVMLGASSPSTDRPIGTHRLHRYYPDYPDHQHPPRSLLAAMRLLQSDDGERATQIRSMLRDSCWPEGNPSYVEMRAHLTDVHGSPDASLASLADVYREWLHAILETECGGACWMRDLDDGASTRPRYPQRPPIIAEALKAGMRVNRNGVTWCWNDRPGSPSCGHFSGNREPSMKLYGNNDTFFCHQCGIWGFSDQIAARTWQGQAR